MDIDLTRFDAAFAAIPFPDDSPAAYQTAMDAAMVLGMIGARRFAQNVIRITEDTGSCSCHPESRDPCPRCSPREETDDDDWMGA